MTSPADPTPSAERPTLEAIRAFWRDKEKAAQLYFVKQRTLDELDALIRADERALAAARESKQLQKDIRAVLSAFNDGRFVRSTKNDNDPAWATAFIDPIAALGRLQDLSDRRATSEGPTPEVHCPECGVSLGHPDFDQGGHFCSAEQVAKHRAARASRAVGEPEDVQHKIECSHCHHITAVPMHLTRQPRAVGEGGTPPLVAEFVAKHAGLWLDRDESYWLARLMQEVGELASSLVGDHPDPVAHELAQVASIAINWMYHGGYAVRAALGTPGETPDADHFEDWFKREGFANDEYAKLHRAWWAGRRYTLGEAGAVRDVAVERDAVIDAAAPSTPETPIDG